MIDEDKIPQPSSDTVDTVANAILDAMEQDNAEKGAFSGQMPREKYRPLMTKFARAAIAAYITARPTPSDKVAQAAADEIAERWFNDDLPFEASLQSLKLEQLRALATKVINKHFTATNVERQEGEGDE